MSELKYTEEHEWLRLEEDGNVTIGITDYAQEQLGDVVFVELPDIGNELSKGDEAAVLESVKAAGEVNSPLSGEIIAINEQLADAPELVNTSPQGEGWFFSMKPADLSTLDSLMDESSYETFLKSL
jgi:glycine cleavage system H protein